MVLGRVEVHHHRQAAVVVGKDVVMPSAHATNTSVL
jgi:hypothetical protein